MKVRKTVGCQQAEFLREGSGLLTAQQAEQNTKARPRCRLRADSRESPKGERGSSRAKPGGVVETVGGVFRRLDPRDPGSTRRLVLLVSSAHLELQLRRENRGQGPGRRRRFDFQRVSLPGERSCRIIKQGCSPLVLVIYIFRTVFSLSTSRQISSGSASAARPGSDRQRLPFRCSRSRSASSSPQAAIA